MADSSAPPRPRHRWFAAAYDLLARADARKTDPLRDMLAGSAAGRVVEIGCGTGLNFAHFDWPKIKRLDATEPDAFMLKRAEEKADALPPAVRAKVSLHEAPAEALPFPDGSMDDAVATLVFCTVTDPARALAEAWRVLRPGGRLFLLEHVAGDGMTWKVQRTVQPVYGWFAAGCHLTRDTESAVREAGFDLEVTRRLQLGPLVPGFAGIATKPG